MLAELVGPPRVNHREVQDASRVWQPRTGLLHGKPLVEHADVFPIEATIGSAHLAKAVGHGGANTFPYEMDFYSADHRDLAQFITSDQYAEGYGRFQDALALVHVYVEEKWRGAHLGLYGLSSFFTACQNLNWDWTVACYTGSTLLNTEDSDLAHQALTKHWQRLRFKTEDDSDGYMALRLIEFIPPDFP